MKQFLPLLKEKSFFMQFFALVLIISVSLLLAMVWGLVLALPYGGCDILTHFDQLSDSSSHRNIVLLKYFQAVNPIGMFVVPVFFFAYLYNRKPIAYLNLKHRVSVPSLLLALLAILAFIPGLNYLVILNEKMVLPSFLESLENWMQQSEEQTQLLTEAFLNVHSFVGLAGNLLIIALLAALGEELLFRGVLLKMFLQNSKNVHLAVWLSAILFSALHMQFYGFVPRMILGVLFGYIFAWTSSLWIPIILHFVFTGISVVVAFLHSWEMITTDIDCF